jgi:broad specificity phosphatase PhoE
MTLYVCRHGRTGANASGLLLGRADPDLDALGRRQAEAIAAALPRPDLVLSSPLVRCRQTAEALGVPVEVDERLVELDYGEYDLIPLQDIPAETWRRWREDPTFRPPGGETLEELAVRVGEALDGVRERARHADVVVVSHVSPIKAALAWALGVSIAVSWRCFVGQASITEIGMSPNGPSLRLFNGVSHLDGIEESTGREAREKTR